MVEGLFPRPCVGCGLAREGGGEFLCPLCLEYIDSIAEPYCQTCGMPAEIDYEYPTGGFQCGLCEKETFRFDRARSLGTYDSVLKRLIHFFKYRKQPGAIQEIKPLLQNHFQKDSQTYEGFRVASVPLHFNKLRERGFDQSFILAQAVAEVLSLPILVQPIRRIRETPPQAKKSRTERAKNVRGAFQVEGPEQMAGQDILLVDDVMTTGSTVNEVARVLKQAGTHRVHVFTLARA